MEHFFHSNKEIEELQKLQIQRHQKVADKYQNITSRVNSSLREARNEDSPSKAFVSNVNQKLDNGETSKLQGHPNSKNSAPVLQNKTTATYQKGSFQSSSKLKGPRLRKGARELVQNKKIQGKVAKAPSDPNLNSERSSVSNSETKYKNQGIQTLDAKHMNNLYAEGTIRY